MKKLFLIGTLFLIASIGYSQTSLYVNPKFEEIAKNHKSIAVVPFKTQVKLRPKQMKDMTPEKLEKLEKDESLGLQQGMQSWFLKRKKKRKVDCN